MQWVKNKHKTDKTDWHLWFAWYPITVSTYNDSNEKKVWLEKVLRRYILKGGKIEIGVPNIWAPEYKERPEQSKAVKPMRTGPPEVKPSTPMPKTIKSPDLYFPDHVAVKKVLDDGK